MQTIELFSGTKSFSKVAARLGLRTFTVDSNPNLYPDLIGDVRLLSRLDFPAHPQILWCSPPCEGFSVASIGRHWNADRTPKSETANQGLDLVRHTLRLIRELQPRWFFIENPRGMLRKQGLLDHLTRHTVTYCQYGDQRMKPTDIWTNADWWMPKPACRNGAPCHVRAPRGSKTGTQGLKSAKERGVIPQALFYEILQQLHSHNCENSDVDAINGKRRIQLDGRVPPLAQNLADEPSHRFAGVANN